MSLEILWWHVHLLVFFPPFTSVPLFFSLWSWSSLQILTVLSIFDSRFLLILLVFPPVHTFFLSFSRPLIFSLHDELRYKVMDACLCGTSPLIVFPFFLSHCSFSSHSTHYLSISPSLLSTLKLFPYSICMLMQAPSLSSLHLLPCRTATFAPTYLWIQI